MKTEIDCEMQFEIEFDYSKGLPGRMYERNGDPGYPEEPPEVEPYKVTLFGVEIPLGDFVEAYGQAELDELLFDAVREEHEADREDYAEYLRDQKEDR